MAKAVVWGGMLIVAFTGIFMGLQLINADSGRLYGFAVGEPDANNECELQLIVSITDKFQDPPQPKFNSTSTTPDWDTWLTQHYNLTDASGNRVDFRKGGFRSKDISEMQFGSGEFIALAKLEAGKTYTLEITPVVGQPEKYIHTIEGAAKEFRRTTFEPNY
ncbi:MAG: hypothetical protein AAF333_14910 [Planctomycetota bacterium]